MSPAFRFIVKWRHGSSAPIRTLDYHGAVEASTSKSTPVEVTVPTLRLRGTSHLDFGFGREQPVANDTLMTRKRYAF